MKRTGSLGGRIAVWLMRSVGMGAWRVGERLGIDLLGSAEGPPYVVDDERRRTFEALAAAARESADGTVDVADCPYPLHELLTYLAVERGLLLHGSRDPSLEVLEPRAAHDFGTELLAVVATDDGIWPLFYAVLARDRVEGIFTACTHFGRPPQLRRLYVFAIAGDPSAAETWTDGVVYAVPRTGFRREWGNEWVSPGPVRPLLRVPVRPDDFPLRDVVVGVPDLRELRRVGRHLRAAKRERAARDTR